MAHALGMTVVGEGIETDGQLEGLVAMECDEGQGFAFAPPLKATEIASLGGATLGGTHSAPAPAPSVAAPLRAEGRNRPPHGFALRAEIARRTAAR